MHFFFCFVFYSMACFVTTKKILKVYVKDCLSYKNVGEKNHILPFNICIATRLLNNDVCFLKNDTLWFCK